MAKNPESLDLSADELRELTKWPDSVIEEFLSFSRTVNIFIARVDALEQLVQSHEAELGYLRSRLNDEVSKREDLEQAVYAA